MNLDADLAAVRTNIHSWIDEYADALLQGRPPPPYVRTLFSAPAVVRRRKPSRRIAATLSDLLDNLEETFDTITKPLSYCGIEHDTRVGLRKLGPHVIPLESIINPSLVIDTGKTLSGMMFIAIPRAETNTETKAVASFYYAVKINRTPQGVEPIRHGTVFEFGYCADFVKHTQWDSAFVVVMNNGSIHVCNQLFSFAHHTSNGTYYQKRCDVPMHNVTIQNRALSREERRTQITKDFVHLVSAWRERDSMWSVSVCKSGNRATFCVPMKETKDYFKNRDKTALTTTGKRKPIFHHVREFERTLPDGKVVTVKEHVRGLRLFDWYGYACAIIAPKFHKWYAPSFDLSSINEEDIKPNESAIFSSKLGSMLANMEDQQKRPSPPATQTEATGTAEVNS